MPEPQDRHRPDLAARNRSGHAGAFLYEDAGWMRDAYEVRRLSMRKVAAEAGCGVRTVARWLALHGIESRESAVAKAMDPPKGPAHPSWRGGPAPCPKCGGRKNFYAKTCAKCMDRTGPAGSNWVGDAIRYEGAHQRVRKVRGPASSFDCSQCGAPAKEWAYDHMDPNELCEGGRFYSVKPERYQPWCVSCHRRFDARRAAIRSAVTVWTVPASVLKVIDGDTVSLKLDLGWRVYADKNCRVLGVNAPEMGTEAGKLAKSWAVTILPVGSAVTFVSHELDKYGRPLGQILYGQPGRLRDFGPDLIAAGHAVLYRG